MAEILKYDLFFVVLLSTTLLVCSLPTSVLVDGKQNEQSSSGTLNKEIQPTSIKRSQSSEHEHGNPITVDKTQSKIHAQKRGVKQNFYEPGMASDAVFSNNLPAGVWDDLGDNMPFNEFQDLDDYPQYIPAFSTPLHHLQQQQQQPQQQRPYENFQHIMSTDNLYDEPLALPVKYKYPTRYFDERRKRGINKNMMRLKRDSTKLNSADMLALLSFLEANQRNRHDNVNDDLNSLEYPKSLYGPYSNFDATNNNNNNDDDDDTVNGGEWLNEWIEPSVQFYGNSRNHFNENARKRYTTPVFPAKKRFMVAKKKRSLNVNHGLDNDKTAHKITNLSSQFTDNAQARF